MNCKMISSSGESQFNLCLKSYQQRNPSTLVSCSRLSIGTKLTMSTLSAKNSSRSCRITARASTTDTYCTQRANTIETFYDMLGISDSVTFPEIKKAYKQLARKYHPDVSPPDQIEENTRRFIMVKEAYDTLSDPHTKSMYDRDLCERLQMAFNSSARKGSQNNVHEERRSMNKTHRGARMRRQ